MKNNPILLCFGTRPEWLKIKPLIKLMDRSEYKLLFTGQHIDLLKDVEVDYKITISQNSNRLDSIISDSELNKSRINIPLTELTKNIPLSFRRFDLGPFFGIVVI